MNEIKQNLNRDIQYAKNILNDIKHNKVDANYTNVQEMYDDLRGIVESIITNAELRVTFNKEVE